MSRSLTADLIRTRWRCERVKRLLWPWEGREKANFDQLRLAFYERFWREAAQNIGAEAESIGHGFWRICKDRKWTLTNLCDVMLDDHLTLEMAGNKPLMSRLLQESGCRVPRFLEYDLTTLGRAQDFLQKLQGPAVVKPASGTGGGKGITTKVCNHGRLRKASLHAAKSDGPLLIEEEVPGHSYRLLYLGGKLIDAVRRDPPAVIGDGQRSVRQLMRDETAARLGDPRQSRALSPLTMDLECVYHLQSQGLTPRQTPAANQRIVVKAVINQNSCRENHGVLEKVHPSLEKMGQRLVTAFGLRLAGLDIIAPDIAVPLEESGGFINEINTTPGLHHHVLAADSGKTPPLGELILEYIFASSERFMIASPLVQEEKTC